MAQDQSTTSRATTQKYLDIYDITNDLLVLRDGSVSLVLQVNALNFGLLSEPEQDAIIYAYAALINSLSYPIEIVVKSLPKDVSRYLEYVDEQMEQTTSELRRQQIQNYRQFVNNLISEQNVLDKNFYVVIPMSALELGIIDSLNPLNSLTNNDKEPDFDKYSLVEKAQNMLLPRRDHLLGQFGRIGLQARQLSTKELIHLFYTAYNREAADGTRVVDTREYTTAAISAAGNITPPAGLEEAIIAPDNSANAQPQAAAPNQAPAPASSQPVNNQAVTPAPVPPAQTPTTDPLEAPTQQYDSTTDSSDINLNNVQAIPHENFTPPNQAPQAPNQNQGNPR